MKRLLIPFILFIIIDRSIAQNISIFRPHKEEVSYPSSEAQGWNLSTIRMFRYNSHGDIILRTTLNKDGTLISKDSIVYNSEFEIKERHSFSWDQKNNKVILKDKVINCFDSKGKVCGSLLYSWKGIWELISGSETIRTYDNGSKQETLTTKIYESENEKWVNLVKEIITFDDQNQIISKTLYSAHPVSKEFEPFTRHNYNGWHNFSKGIFKELINEKYENNGWILESKSTIRASGSLWLQEEDRIIEGAKYKIMFSDDNSFREVLKASPGGWLALSIYNKENKIEKTTQNEFNGDMLLKIFIKEIETNEFGRPIRILAEEVTPDGNILQYSEVLHDLTYSSENHLLEDIAKVKTSKTGLHTPAIRHVYSDYKDVALVLGNDDDVRNEIVIYPNPGNGIFTFLNYTHEFEKVKVYSLTGALISEQTIINQQVDLLKLNKGIYLLQLCDGRKLPFKKIIVQ